MDPRENMEATFTVTLESIREGTTNKHEKVDEGEGFSREVPNLSQPMSEC